MMKRRKVIVQSSDQSRIQVDAAYAKLIRRLVKWAESHADIRGAIIVGSRARGERPADEWADLDVILIVTDPKRLLSRVDWLKNLGEPLLTFLEPTATGGETERRVIFEGMLDADFSIIPKKTAEGLLEGGILSTDEILNTFGRGMKVLVDKDRMAERLQRFLDHIKKPTPMPPTQDEFLQVVNDFLYHAVFTAKHLRRGELWWALTCLDCYMQRLLLQMIEWHAHAVNSWDYDTWFRGRFLEEWVNPHVLKEMRSSFARYDEKDTRRALLSSMNLFHELATETARKLKYSYPAIASEQVKKWISNCLQITR